MSHLQFWSSTHCKHWLFEEKELCATSEYLRAKWNLDAKEEDLLWSYLTDYIFRLCWICKYGHHVAGIASIIFRRIYVAQVLNMIEIEKSKQNKESDTNNSKNDAITENTELKDIYDPRAICVLCVIIAAKSETHVIDFDQFVEKYVSHLDKPLSQYLLSKSKNKSNNILADLEMEILTLIKFDYNIFLPFDACLDFLSKCAQLDILSHVWKIILMSFRSDIYVRYPPYLIALSVIYIVCAAIHKKPFHCYLIKFKIPLNDILECSQFIMQCLTIKMQDIDMANINDSFESSINGSNYNSKQKSSSVASNGQSGFSGAMCQCDPGMSIYSTKAIETTLSKIQKYYE